MRFREIQQKVYDFVLDIYILAITIFIYSCAYLKSYFNPYFQNALLNVICFHFTYLFAHTLLHFNRACKDVFFIFR